MAPVFPIFCLTYFVLIQTVVLNVADGESRSLSDNTTDHVASETSATFGNFTPFRERHKRSLFDHMPKQLTLSIKFPTGDYANLIWTRSTTYLANEHLPVITLLADLQPNVMYDFGEFVAYHDEDHCSAVVYFGTLNVFYGVIGMNYYIEALPYNFNERGEYLLGIVDEPYIRWNSHSFNHIHPGKVLPPPSDKDAWIDFFRLPGYNPDHTRQRQSNCHLDASTDPKQQRIAEGYHHGGNSKANERRRGHITRSHWGREDHGIYLEILVFITQDIVDTFKADSKDDYFHWIIRYHIVYFNAVDMMFKKLRNEHTGIHINIAKIAFEDALLLPFDFMSNGDRVQFADIVDKLPQYLHSYQHEYPQDSFDHVFIHTGRTIMDHNVPVKGLTKYGHDLYSARKNNQFYEVVPITVVQMKSGYADYVHTVHEIGRTFDLGVEPGDRGLDAGGQCESIMQREGPKCGNCLSWSSENQIQFDKFRSQNKNICFLLNKPRSLRRPGPSMFLRPNRQCKCFGYESYKTNENDRVWDTVRVYGCSIPLTCEAFNVAKYSELSVRPFDGTPCSNRKVCWNGVCELITQ